MIAIGKPYWVCYDGVNAYQVTPMCMKYLLKEDQAWTCLTPMGKGNIWASKMFPTEEEAIESCK